MKRTYKYSVNHSAALFSAFDVGGSLLLGNNTKLANDTQYDMNQLGNDQKVLEEDYRNACEKIAKNQ
jgi:hypothetical protein